MLGSWKPPVAITTASPEYVASDPSARAQRTVKSPSDPSTATTSSYWRTSSRQCSTTLR